MTEAGILNRILIDHGARPGVRLFRNSVGAAWMGEVVGRSGNRIVLENPRRVEFGWGAGSSDVLGWRSIVITPEMVGHNLAQLVALEVKGARGRISQAQQRFCDVVRAAGGLAGVVRSSEDAASVLGGAA